MAVTVPVYEQGQVRHNNLPGARYSDAGGNVAGEAVGQAIGSAGDMLGKIAEAENQKVVTAAAMEAEAKLRGQQNTMLFGDGTGKNIGAFGTKGKDAFGLIEKVLPEFEKQRTEIASLMNGQQRAMFEQRTADWGAQMQGDLLRHIARESDSYTKETTKAYIDSAAQTATLFYNDPARVDAEIQRAQDAYIVGNPGDPPEATRLAMQGIDSSVRRGILNRIMVESPSQAQAYFDKYRDKFTGTDQAEIERVLTPLAKADRGEQIGRDVWAGGAPGATGYAAYRRALESGGDANARNPNSSATGADQFTEGTWLRMVESERPAWADGKSRAEILAMRTDADKSGEMADALDRKSSAALMRAGQPATNENLYASHHFGEAAGVKFARASDDTPVESILSSDAIAANPYLRGKTKGQVVANWNARALRSVGTSAADKKQYILDTVQDDTERKAAINYVERQEAVTKQRAADQEKTISETLNRKVEQADPSTPFAKIATPQELAFAQEKGWVDKFETRLKERAGGGTQTTPRDQLLAYRAVAYNAARGDEASKHELSRYNPYDPKITMSQQDRDWLAGQQKDILSGDPAKQAKAASEGEINNIIQTYAVNTIGVDKKKLGTDPAAIAFDRDMRLWADQFQRVKGYAPSYTETLKHADLVTIEKMGYTRVEPGKLWDSKIETTVAELKIPPLDRQQIVEALYATGRPVNGANVAEMWRKKIKAAK